MSEYREYPELVWCSKCDAATYYDMVVGCIECDRAKKQELIEERSGSDEHRDIGNTV